MKILVGILVAIFLALLLGVINVQSVGALLFGWIPFLYRVLPAMEVDWPNLALGVGAAMLLAVGIQWLGSWWCSQPGAAGTSGWSIRWTIMLVISVVVLFAAGLSVIGVVHQVSWLMHSEPPAFEQVIGNYGDRSDRSREIGHAIGSCGNDKRLPQNTFSPDGMMLHSWETDLLPYMLFVTQGIDKNRPWYDPCNAKNFKCIIPAFINPDLGATQFEDKQGYGLSHYAANEHVIGGNKATTLADITDGAANTLLVGEVNANFAQWANPVNWRDPAIGINRSPKGFGGPANSDSVHFLNADGSTRLVNNRVSPEVLRALSTPHGNERISTSE